MKESRDALQSRVALWESIEQSSAELEAALNATLSRLEQHQTAERLEAATVLLALEKYQVGCGVDT